MYNKFLGQNFPKLKRLAQQWDCNCNTSQQVDGLGTEVSVCGFHYLVFTLV